MAVELSIGDFLEIVVNGLTGQPEKARDLDFGRLPGALSQNVPGSPVDRAAAARRRTSRLGGSTQPSGPAAEARGGRGLGCLSRPNRRDNAPRVVEERSGSAREDR
jgi:hypothetical protein